MKEEDFEPDLWKEQIGISMKSIGFETVHYQKQEKLPVNECCIYYKKIWTEICSTESYNAYADIVIRFFETVDKNLFGRICEIINNIEHDFVNNDNLPYNTTFKISKTEIEDMGTSYIGELMVELYREVDHF